MQIVECDGFALLKSVLECIVVFLGIEAVELKLIVVVWLKILFRACECVVLARACVRLFVCRKRLMRSPGQNRTAADSIDRGDIRPFPLFKVVRRCLCTMHVSGSTSVSSIQVSVSAEVHRLTSNFFVMKWKIINKCIALQSSL